MSFRGLRGTFFARGGGRGGWNLSTRGGPHKRSRDNEDDKDDGREDSGGYTGGGDSGDEDDADGDDLITNAELDADELRLRLAGLQTEDQEHDNDEEAVALGNLGLDTALAARALGDYNDSPPVEKVIPTMDEEEADAADHAIESVDNEQLPDADTQAQDETTNAEHGTAATTPAQQPTIDVVYSGDLSTILDENTTSVGDIPSAELGIAMWAVKAGISRSDFSALTQVLSTVPDLSPELAALPMTIDTLKKHLYKILPILELRQCDVALLASRTAVTGRAVTTEVPIEKLHFFNPQKLFTRILASEIKDKMYFGIGHFVDAPVENWEAAAWTSSIRSTSGQFAKYKADARQPPKPPLEDSKTKIRNASSVEKHDFSDFIGEPGGPILPSDFVRYECHNNACACHGPTDASTHAGQVVGIGIDDRSDAEHPGNVVVKIRALIRQTGLPEDVREMNPQLLGPKEFVIDEDDISYVLPSVVSPWCFGTITVHYQFQSRTDFTSAPALPVNWTSDMLHTGYVIRRIFSRTRYKAKQPCVRPVWQARSIRGELEILHFGRRYLLNTFANNDLDVISLPLKNFTDGFGLYRNMHRSLMGFYFLFANLSFQEANRRSNVVAFTLGPHGSNLADVVAAIAPYLLALDAGEEIDIPGRGRVLLCAFTSYFIGDMPQQKKNSGLLSQNANYGCGKCIIRNEDQAILQYDTVTNGRYHHENERARQRLESRRNKSQKQAEETATGMSAEAPAMQVFTPALDIIWTRLNDPAHSEYAGLTHLMNKLLLEAALLDKAKLEFAVRLKAIPFPPGWGRLPSPINHLTSYKLSEHARASVIFPLTLRNWLKDEHLKPFFANAIKVNLSELAHQISIDSGFPVAGISAAGLIVRVLSAVARSNTNLMSNSSNKQQRAEFMAELISIRYLFQRLMEAAAQASRDNPRSREVTPASSRRGSISGSSGSTSRPATRGSAAQAGSSRAESQALPLPIPARVTKGSQRYASDEKRPNVHVGLHYQAAEEEIGANCNAAVLVGEDKHRELKDDITSTNHQNPERDLLRRQSLEWTMRLLIQNGFPEYPRLTQQMQDLFATCPKLFEAILPRSEQSAFDARVQEGASSAAAQDGGIATDPHHSGVIAGERVDEEYCKLTLKVPLTAARMPTNLRKDMQTAYRNHYDMSVIPTDSRVLKWWGRFSFDDSISQRRIVYRQGDFVRHSDDSIGLVKHIFTHKPTRNKDDTSKLFVRIVPLHLGQGTDPLLVLPIGTLGTEQEEVTVGLPTISGKKIWVVRKFAQGDDYTKDPIAGDQFFVVTWDVQFL